MASKALASALGATLGATTTLFVGVLLFAQDSKPTRRSPPGDPGAVEVIKPTSQPGGRYLLLARPEFQPGAIERGEADEPGIAAMGADWSNEVELRAKLDRTEFRQLQRIHMRCEVTKVNEERQYWVPPVAPRDRYLKMRVRVFDAKGKLVPMTEFYKHEGRDPEVWIGGGGSTMGGFLRSRVEIDVIPNLIYDMTRPGEYWVLVEMQLNASYPPTYESAFYVRAAPIRIKVLPEVYRLANHRNAVIDPE